MASKHAITTLYDLHTTPSFFPPSPSSLFPLTHRIPVPTLPLSTPTLLLFIHAILTNLVPDALNISNHNPKPNQVSGLRAVRASAADSRPSTFKLCVRVRMRMGWEMKALVQAVEIWLWQR